MWLGLFGKLKRAWSDDEDLARKILFLHLDVRMLRYSVDI